MADSDVLLSGLLPHYLSAQAAELIALTEAYWLLVKHSQYIQTLDMRLGSLMILAHFGSIGTSSHRLVKRLLTMVSLEIFCQPFCSLSLLLLCKCAAHTHAKDAVFRGNAAADATVKLQLACLFLLQQQRL